MLGLKLNKLVKGVPGVNIAIHHKKCALKYLFKVQFQKY